MADKNRYWTGVGYLENMHPDWENKISNLLQVPYAYCIHNLDKDSKSEHRKNHVHIILAFSNTTTYKHALDVLQTLSIPGERAFNTCQPVFSIRHIYDYLIHDTEQCRKDGKYQYDKTCRVCGNNFDIGCFEVLSTADKDIMLDELADFLIDNDCENFATFFTLVRREFDNKEYARLVRSNSGFFERLCKGIYHINHNPIGG